MKTAKLSDAELVAYSGDHLLYEWQLFLFTKKELSEEIGGPMRFVLIESFLIHLRNLIDFFYTTGRDDDVVAADFCPGWNERISDKLREAKARANKELTHLTLKRRHVSDPSKVWDMDGLFQEVHVAAKAFVAKASPAKLHPNVEQWVMRFSGPSSKDLTDLYHPSGEAYLYLWCALSSCTLLSCARTLTFNADKSDSELAREEARSQNTTLNELFRDWLKGIACRVRARKYRALMDDLRYADAGRKFTRDEMNE
jgi:hypothetical protein